MPSRSCYGRFCGTPRGTFLLRIFESGRTAESCRDAPGSGRARMGPHPTANAARPLLAHLRSCRKRPHFLRMNRGGTAPARQGGTDSGRQGRAALGVPGRRSCRPCALALFSASASVASDTEKGVGMSLRKRGGIWWVDVVAPNGERIRRTTGTANKALAQEFHDRLKSELWRLAQTRREAAADLERGGGTLAQGAGAQGDGQGRCHQAALARSVLGWQGPGHHQSRADRPDHRREACARA